MKSVGIILLVVVVAAGAYVLFGKNRNFSIRTLNETVSRAWDKVGGNLSLNSVEDEAKDLYDTATEKGQEAAQEVSDKAKIGVYDTVKQTVIDPLNEFVKKTLGIDSSPSAIEKSVQSVISFVPPADEFRGAGYLVKVGDAASFNLKNPFFDSDGGEGAVFSVEWGDGASEVGSFQDSELRVVSHSWGQSGEYFIQFSFDNGGGDLVDQRVYIVVY